jgi:hypothetical protein
MRFAFSATKPVPVAAQIAGFTKAASWPVALAAAQQRHPLLQVCIAKDQGGAPYFRRLNEAVIPLRVVHCGVSANWEREMALELATPLPATSGPLLRVVLMHEENRSMLIGREPRADGSPESAIVRYAPIAAKFRSAAK